jgi:serine/threonine-protein kinase
MTTSHFARSLKSLSPAYRLKSTLGSGGAAHVYLADETRSGRRVAIKVLREELAASVTAARFLAEVGIAARLAHPNIVPVYASGSADGLPYYVMPFIEGQSLRTRLTAAGRLPLDEVVQITTQIADALDYAHARRVVHRDIKPENVLLHAGRALVLDFGIALALDATDQQRRTGPGIVLGTPDYMSPEQARAGATIDSRSDVYSLACVVYEMIWGRPPFVGAPTHVVMRHLEADPMPLSCRLPTLSHAVSAAVSRALTKLPERRFQSAGSFAAALANECENLDVFRGQGVRSAESMSWRAAVKFG